MPQNAPSPQYDVWTAVRSRSSSNGIAMLPVAGPWPTPAQPVVLHGGVETETIAGGAVSIGAPPVIPSPQSLRANKNRVYLGGSQSACFPCVAVGGLKIYAVTFAYTWGILAPEGLDGDLSLGVQPWDTDGAPGEYLPAINLNDNLVNAGVGRQLQPTQPPQTPPLGRVIIQTSENP